MMGKNQMVLFRKGSNIPEIVYPGQIISHDDYEEPLEIFRFEQYPDPDHQSSLDYLNGV